METGTGIVPEGDHSVSPWIIGRRTAELIDFLIAVFGATDLGRVEADGRIQHAEVRIGDSVVLLFDSWPHRPATPAFLRHHVADAAAVLERAAAAGATVLTRPTELAWGDRVSRFADPFGNLHWIHQRVAEPDEDELRRRWTLPEFQHNMAYAQSLDSAPER